MIRDLSWIDGASRVAIGLPVEAELYPRLPNDPMPVFDMFAGREVTLFAPGRIDATFQTIDPPVV